MGVDGSEREFTKFMNPSGKTVESNGPQEPVVGEVISLSSFSNVENPTCIPKQNACVRLPTSGHSLQGATCRRLGCWGDAGVQLIQSLGRLMF